MQRCAILFVLCLRCLSVLGSSEAEAVDVADSIVAKMRQREEIVKEIALAAEAVFQGRHAGARNCSCSFHSCANEFGDDSQMECTAELIFGECDKECEEPKRMVDYSRSGIRMPFSTNLQRMSPGQKVSICLTQLIEDAFAQVKTKHGVTNSWTYVGLRNGVHRSWPLRARHRNASFASTVPKECNDYDPRKRPWYNAASTGPKDVILLLDRSVSTRASAGRIGETSSIWNSMQRAAESLMETFTHADYINIVLLSSQAEELWKESALVQAKEENRDLLKDQIAAASPEGATNIAAGFEMAADLFINASQTVHTSRSNRLILFMTEGKDTKRSTSEVLEGIEAAQVKLQKATESRAHVFTYSFGPNADESLAQQISCANQGVWAPIRDFDDPLTDMGNYLDAMALSRAALNKSVWVDVYEDASGLGNLTTVSYPFFAGGRGQTMSMLLGVVGHDVRLEDLGTDEEAVYAVIQDLSQNQTRTPFLVDECELQVWRSIQYPHAECPDIYPQDVDCFHFRDFWYRRFDEKVSRYTAEEMCREQDGFLAPVRDLEQLRFLSALASPDKSWLGGERILGADPITFRFPNEGIHPTIDQYHQGWAAQQPGDSREICMTIDRRNVSGNLETSACEDAYGYICEYPSPAAAECGGNVLDLNEGEKLRAVNRSQSVDCPQMEAARVVFSPIDGSGVYASEDVICDFGEIAYPQDLYCCQDCHGSRLTSAAAPLRTFPSVLIFTLTLVICLF